MFNYDEVFWLNLTNLVLGLATLVCFVVIGYSVLKEIRERVMAKAAPREPVDDHAFVIDGLGITMADGGERVGDDEMLIVSEDGIENAPKKERYPGRISKSKK